MAVKLFHLYAKALANFNIMSIKIFKVKLIKVIIKVINIKFTKIVIANKIIMVHCIN